MGPHPRACDTRRMADTQIEVGDDTTPTGEPTLDLASLSGTDLFFNRELSLLEFNRRVLAQAEDASLPLLERLRFLTICTSNLDEFFEVRVSGLKQQERYGTTPPGIDGVAANEVIRRVSRVAHELVERQYRVFNEQIVPALHEENIHVLRRAIWNADQKRWIREFFRETVKPVLTPIALDPAHPFPMVANKGLCFMVRVDGNDAFKREAKAAVVQVPRSLPRVIKLPETEGSPEEYVLLSSIVHAHIGQMFPGMRILSCHQFRVTRNSDLWVDEEEVENLMHALQGELSRRNLGEAVRLEVADDMPDALCDMLLEKESLDANVDMYKVDGPVNLHRLAAICDLVDRPDLKFRPFLPGISKRIRNSEDLFATIAARDVLLHHPYQSFAPVVELMRQAARDPNVLAIKQTLYRTDADSPIVQALIDAALAGKDVTVLVELRARFDEAANISQAQRLEEVGANVVYGIVGYKAHAKMLLIVRREGDRIVRYVHLGTGNYHTKTTRAYTDMGLLSARKHFGEDVQQLFDQLTGLGQKVRLRRLLQSPFTMYRMVIRLIGAEAEAARAGKPARIRARMNSLSEKHVIQALYEASQAGVQIDLIVRGICCLRPGVPGLSENIRVRSIIGRFLEHTRGWCFHAGGKSVVYLSSADWMSRNLHRRVETAFPIQRARMRDRIVREAIDTYLEDNAGAWLLQQDGSYRRASREEGEPRVSAQETLLEKWAE